MVTSFIITYSNALGHGKWTIGLIVAGNNAFLEDDVAVESCLAGGDDGVGLLSALVEFKTLLLVDVDSAAFGVVADRLVLGPDGHLE